MSVFDRRQCGVLCHPTSLHHLGRGPEHYFGGDLGPAARSFVDWLARAGQSWWQMLPVVPPGNGSSPYDSSSAFAGASDLLSPDDLFSAGLLTREELESARGQARRSRASLVAAAYSRFKGARGSQRRLDSFRARHISWLEDFALFAAIRAEQAGAPWWQWPRELRERKPRALVAARERLQDEVDYQAFVQLCFDQQLSALRRYAEERGIQLMGDVPMYVARDSADVWQHPELFKLDKGGTPRVVAGVPADAFNADGQLWGNPIYDWKRHAATGFAWWLARFARCLEYFHALRIDHFIGLARCWEVPFSAASALDGRFRRVPGRALLEAAEAELGAEPGGLPFIAEDLGILTPEVERLRDDFGLLGMRVLQFGFGEDSQHLPHLYPERSLAVTGTHDTNTLIGWYKDLQASVTTQGQAERAKLQQYLGELTPSKAHHALLRACLGSVSQLAILPLQDVLGLGGRARMNVPGTTEGNWAWQLRPGALKDTDAAWLAETCAAFDR
ncbi:MAG: 4-alpha-glucanotransferase [Polyangiaceae bacterium]|nr:4-alpha-glucanotransferase [Myxococcales bacterium]MCB9584777.1 4-alpha-glucanotransferase [Polyangiaceae bacterium]MCB9607650.1 4-alpha-glucanotransferase [Polyangiaceae bacterium]